MGPRWEADAAASGGPSGSTGEPALGLSSGHQAGPPILPPQQLCVLCRGLGVCGAHSSPSPVLLASPSSPRPLVLGTQGSVLVAVCCLQPPSVPTPTAVFTLCWGVAPHGGPLCPRTFPLGSTQGMWEPKCMATCDRHLGLHG